MPEKEKPPAMRVDIYLLQKIKRKEERVMKKGKSISELYDELQRQREVRKDLVADTRTMKVSTEDGRSMLTIGAGRRKESY